jgi:hypothetical protein
MRADWIDYSLPIGKLTVDTSVRDVSRALRRLRTQGVAVGRPRIVGFGKRITRDTNGIIVRYRERGGDTSVEVFKRPDSGNDSAHAISHRIIAGLRENAGAAANSARSIAV